MQQLLCAGGADDAIDRLKLSRKTVLEHACRKPGSVTSPNEGELSRTRSAPRLLIKALMRQRRLFEYEGLGLHLARQVAGFAKSATR